MIYNLRLERQWLEEDNKIQREEKEKSQKNLADLERSAKLKNTIKKKELQRLKVSEEDVKRRHGSIARKLNGHKHRRSQYEANRGTRLGKILPNTVDFYFFYQTDNIRRFHTADFVQRTVCSPRL